MRKFETVLGIVLVIGMVLLFLGLIGHSIFGAEPSTLNAPFGIRTFITPRNDDVSPYLWVQITIPEDRMLYAMEQTEGAPVTALKITINGSRKSRVGEFEHIGPPVKMKLVNDVLVYYHTGQATYNAPVAILGGLGRNEPLSITGTIRYGLCGEDFCLPPVTVPFSVRLRK